MINIKKKIIHQFVLVIFLIISILLIIVLFYFTRKEFQQVNKNLNDKIENLLNFSASAFSVPLWNYTTEIIEDLSITLLRNDEIIAVFIYENDLMVSGIYKDNYKINSASNLIFNDKNFDYSNNDYLKVVDKLVLDNKVIGKIVIFYTDYFARQEIAYRQNNLIYLFSVLLILIVVFVVLFVKQKLVTPVLKLLRFSEEIAHSKDFTKEINVISQDEIGQLCEGFNYMIKKLHQRDIERDELEEKLRKIQSYLNNIIQSMPSMLITVDENSRITQWNQAATENTGISATEVIGKKIEEVAPFLLDYISQYDDSFQSKKPMYFYRKQLETIDKGFKNISLYPLTTNGVKGLVLRIDDITELEKKEDQLRQMQKMETVGILAGGLAHDFNNVLGGILGVLSLLSYKINKGKDINRDELIEFIQTMEESGDRAVDMVKQLLTLSRKQEFSFTLIDLNQSVKHVVKICKNTFDKSITINVKQNPKEAFVNADPTQIEQVILNLCVNASHAMTIMKHKDEAQGGILNISIDSIKADSFFCETHPEAEQKEYYKLSVCDTGVGMDATLAAKIFDPFFTTKEKGKGTGLGLAMVYNIVKQHKGFIDLYTEKNIGSTFSVYLPVMDKEHLGIFSPEKEFDTFSGKGIVLVVDDEKVMRKIAGQMLKIFGFDTIYAEDGEEGVKVYKERMNEIKFVLLDMVMPKMSGKDVFLEIKKVNPNAKVILSSGFRQDERVEEVIQHGVDGFVQKPYILQTLSDKLFEIFGKSLQ